MVALGGGAVSYERGTPVTYRGKVHVRGRVARRIVSGKGKFDAGGGMRSLRISNEPRLSVYRLGRARGVRISGFGFWV